MRFLWLAAALVGTLGAAAGCGDDKRPGIAPGGGSGSKPGSSVLKGGSGNMGGEGGEGGSGDILVDPLAPVVTVTSPERLDDPNEGGVLLGPEVAVSCLVKKSALDGSSRVDTNSVKLALLAANGKVLDEKPSMPGEGIDEFTATFSLTEIPTGRLGIRCSAADIDQRFGADTALTFVDKGPAVTFTSPLPDTFYPVTELLVVDFTVEAAPLTDDDEGAAVDSVSLDAAGVIFDLKDAETDEPGHYRLELELTDLKLFMPRPDGDMTLTVTASNQRVAGNTSRVATIDGVGPTLQIVNPTAEEKVVGGTVALSFSAVDATSGVDPESVVVTLNNVPHPFDAGSEAWSLANNVFTFEFDSRQVQGGVAQIAASVAVQDNVGNASATDMTLYLDNVPPIVDLDPENVRTQSLEGKCSVSFDPVGDGAIDDISAAIRTAMFRALVWERTNVDLESTHQWFSGTAGDSVRLYLRPGGLPLLIDESGDGVCDEVIDVNSTAFVSLKPIADTGQPQYSDADGEKDQAPAMGKACTPQAGTPPPKLCPDQASDMRYVLKHFTQETETAIYGHDVNTATCTGQGYEFGTKLGPNDDGWVCFVARAVDNVGNVGVSRPLRVCVDDTSKPGTPACATSSVDPPSCTQSCTAPPRFPASIVTLR